MLMADAVPSVFIWKHKGNSTHRTSSTSLLASSSTVEEKENVGDAHRFDNMVDHSYSFSYSPQEMKRKYEETVKTLKDKNQELENTKRREKRAKVTTERLLKEVKDLKQLSDQATEMLESYKDIPVELFSKPPTEYSNEQKQFSSTLYFYGPKAYGYLREKINLPHPSTIRRWLSKINSQPGFSAQVFEMLKDKKNKDSYNYTYCSVMLDAMSIRKHIDWDPKRKQMVGFVDLGSGSLENDVSEAHAALVILAVGLKGYWKVPIGYFLIDGISAEVQCQLILTALGMLYDVGLRAVSVVMDGHPTNQKMAGLLKCNLDSDNTCITSHFQHPSDVSLKADMKLQKRYHN